MIMLKNFGFVFTGGGAKGAWQLGVWKAFEEKGYRAKAVSGTSVGALNAALYAQGDYAKAEEAWNDINSWRLLHPDLFNIVMKGMPASLAKGFLTKCNPSVAAIMEWFGGSSKEDGFCLQDGLRELIDGYLNLNKRNHWLPFFVCAHSIEESCPEYFAINSKDDWSSKEIADILLASAAIPVIYSSVNIRGKEYNDGGGGVLTFLFDDESDEYDNAPRAPLQRLPLDLIITLELNFKQNNDCIQKTKKGLYTAKIVPSEHLGDFIDGTIKFDNLFVNQLIDLGYKDGLNWLNRNDVQLKLERVLGNSSILPKITFD